MEGWSSNGEFTTNLPGSHGCNRLGDSGRIGYRVIWQELIDPNIVIEGVSYRATNSAESESRTGDSSDKTV